MPIDVVTGVVHMPFGERRQYGSPYPQGIAVAGVTFVGDASGNPITITINADPGRLYRLELFGVTIGNTVLMEVSAITAHRWAAERSGLGPAQFDLNWLLEREQGDTFAHYDMKGSRNAGPGGIEAARRFPMGQLSGPPGVSVILASLTLPTNNGVGTSHEMHMVCTYWDKQALYLPGFLSSFYGSPVVASPLQEGT